MSVAAHRSIADVGGWFAVRAYLSLLTPEADKAYREASLEGWGRDMVLDGGPTIWAFEGLQHLLPEAKITADFSTLTTDKVKSLRPELEAKWRDWIEKNKAELSKLQPDSRNLHLSAESCRALPRQ